MTGISEILVLVLLICVVLIIPRMMAPASSKRSGAKTLPHKRLTAGMRAGIVISVLVPVISALICKPWAGSLIPFIITGVLPVALAWGGFWVLSARKN